MSPQSLHEFELAFPLLTMACKVCDYDSSSEPADLFDILIGTAIDRRFAEAETELMTLPAPVFLEVVETDPGEEHPAAPIASRVLSSIFA